MPANSKVRVFVIFGLVLIVFSGCAARTSRNPWLKPATLWTDQDSTRVWYDSPWVKVKRLKRGVITDRVPARSSPLDPNWTPNVSDSSYWYVDTTEFRIRWVSAHTMCLAEHPWVLTNPQDSTCVESDEYRIFADPPWTGSVDSERALSQHSYIRARKLGIRLAPNSVEHVIGGKFILRFPKVMPDGRPVVALDETAVEVIVSDGKHSWKVKFKPQEMVGPTGRDL